MEISFVSSSDSEVYEVEEYGLELEGSFCKSDETTDERYLHEACTDEPLADAEWFDAVESVFPYFEQCYTITHVSGIL